MNSVIRLGEHESTVLTNNSNFITVITDLPYTQRCRTHFGSSFSNTTGKYLRGSRPMHKTTICFEEKPSMTDYSTTTSNAYSGKKNVEKGTVPNKCQSLHHSHISFGTSTSMDLKTQTTNSFNRKTLIPASKLHEDQKRWNDQMLTGYLMDKSLRHIGFGKEDHETTYGKVHGTLGRSIPRSKPAIKKPPEKYHILSGASLGPEMERSLRLNSGNRVLQKIRERYDSGLFG